MTNLHSEVRNMPWLALAFLSLASTALAQDVDAYQIVRYEYFTQATTNRASTDAAAIHDLGAYVFERYAGSIQSAAITSPKGWNQAMVSFDNHFYLPEVPGETVFLSQPA